VKVLFPVAAVSGLADVDAVTVAFTQLGAGSLYWRVPAAAIALAVVVNTVVKLGIGYLRGSPAFRKRIAGALAATAAGCRRRRDRLRQVVRGAPV